VGPVDIAVIGFDGALGDTGIAAAVAQAVDTGAVRVLDVLVVQKAQDGTVTMIDAETTEDSQELLGFPTDLPDMVGEADALAVAAEIPPGTSVLLIVWENAWAARISDEVQASGGRLLTLERIPADDIRDVLETIDAGTGGAS
jgi:hypothetical protein